MSVKFGKEFLLFLLLASSLFLDSLKLRLQCLLSLEIFFEKHPAIDYIASLFFGYLAVVFITLGGASCNNIIANAGAIVLPNLRPDSTEGISWNTVDT